MRKSRPGASCCDSDLWRRCQPLRDHDPEGAHDLFLFRPIIAPPRKRGAMDHSLTLVARLVFISLQTGANAV